jgi:hypothetical protein
MNMDHTDWLYWIWKEQFLFATYSQRKIFAKIKGFKLKYLQNYGTYFDKKG